MLGAYCSLLLCLYPFVAYLRYLDMVGTQSMIMVVDSTYLESLKFVR